MIHSIELNRVCNKGWAENADEPMVPDWDSYLVVVHNLDLESIVIFETLDFNEAEEMVYKLKKISGVR